ncbi:MAG: AAA family ATPase [Verrucomicrobiales bacterium]|nr:AAA family ATPase [Verrucomicrobiales bacterium]
MFEHVLFQNFRCFESISLKQLRRVNLVVGANNAGKTTLLEGLFLMRGAHNPEISLRLNVWRGVQQFATTWDEMWGWLFFGKRTDRTIELSAQDTDGLEETVSVRITPPREFEVSVSGQDELPLSSSRRSSAQTTEEGARRIALEVELCDLMIDYHDSEGRKFATRARFTPDGSIRVEQARAPYARKAVFLHTHALNFKEHAEQFSRLKAVGAQEAVVAALRSVDARLRSLDILVIGGQPVLHADIGIDRPVPLPLMGEGFNRILAIVLGIVSYPGGIVLIDGVENGLFFSALEHLWEAIRRAAVEADVQVFATTHSRECVFAANRVFRGEADALSLIRLQHVGENLEAVQLDAKHLEMASEMGLEIRA